MKKEGFFRLLAPISGYIASQLAGPQGWFGRVVMTRVLNRGNRELIESALNALDLQPTECLLDVGFGGGGALELAAQRGIKKLAGADPSADAVTAVRNRFASRRSQLDLRLETASVEALPFESMTFDGLLSTNTVYFWSDLEGAFREMHRVLQVGGRIALGFSGSHKLRGFDMITQHGFRFHETDTIVENAHNAGFADVQVLTLSGRDTTGDFVLLAKRS